MTREAALQWYFQIMIVASFAIAASAFICWLRTRTKPALKYYTRQQFGTVVGQLGIAISLIMIVAEPRSIGALIGVVAILPATIVQVVGWVMLMLSSVALLNGIWKPQITLIDTHLDAAAGAAVEMAKDAHDAQQPAPPAPIEPAAVEPAKEKPDDQH